MLDSTPDYPDPRLATLRAEADRLATDGRQAWVEARQARDQVRALEAEVARLRETLAGYHADREQEGAEIGAALAEEPEMELEELQGVRAALCVQRYQVEQEQLRAEIARLQEQTGTLTTLLEQVRNRVSRCFYSPARESEDAALLQAIDAALCPEEGTSPEPEPGPPALDTPRFLRCDGCGEVFPIAEIALRSNVDFCRACEAESRAGMTAEDLLAAAWGLTPPEEI